ncbi:MAG: PhzF family phenazine biosynthesis protein [bacterium]
MVRTFIVDAFADKPFSGNPAAVCLLDGPAPEEWMKAVAREMNLSETAFVHREAGTGSAPVFRLRWFTPAKEVVLCGHATLASAHVLWESGTLAPTQAAEFETLSGRLTCKREGDGIAMDFPANPGQTAPAPDGLWKALGIKPAPVLRNHLDYLMVVTDEAAVRSIKPDFAALAKLSDVHGFILTAPAGDGVHDYVCRYFVPAFGIDEDPVTGSIQTMLGPYWCERLGKKQVRSWQASARGGGMTVRPAGKRVMLIGRAVTTLRADLLAGPSISVAA